MPPRAQLGEDGRRGDRSLGSTSWGERRRTVAHRMLEYDDATLTWRGVPGQGANSVKGGGAGAGGFWLGWGSGELHGNHSRHTSPHHSPHASPKHAKKLATGLRRFYVLIVCTAVFTALLSFLNDIVIAESLALRARLLTVTISVMSTLSDSAVAVEVACLLLWVLFEMTVAASAHLWSRRRPMSYGSGIPEIKCELQRTHMKGLLHEGMLSSKIGGLMLAEAAGLPVGKEGPFVHTAAIIWRHLMDYSFFREVQRVPGYVEELMAISMTVGLCSSFGVPVGGVLFALEVVPEATTGNMTYWSCIWAACAGSLVLRVVPLLLPGPLVNLLPPIDRSTVVGDPLFQSMVLAVFSIPLGMICGLLGALFVRMQAGLHRRLRMWMTGSSAPKPYTISTARSQLDNDMGEELLHENEYRVAWVSSRPEAWSAGDERPAATSASCRALFVVLLVAGVDALVSFTVPFLRGSTQAQQLWELASLEDIAWSKTRALGQTTVPALPHDALLGPNKSHGDALVCELLCGVWKFVITMFAISLPIPAGCIMPSYIIGALFGRSYAIFLVICEEWLTKRPAQFFQVYVDFALIGATAYTAAVCRSFSVVIAVFELVGVPRLMLPLSLASIFAIFVANQCGPSFFEAAACIKSLPILHQARSFLDGHHTVSKVMQTDVPLVPEELGDEEEKGQEFMREVLARFPDALSFGVVAGGPGDLRSLPLIGVAPRSVVERLAFAPAGSPSADPHAEVPKRINRDVLKVAHQVPTGMPVRDAEVALALQPGSDLYVVHAGRVHGKVGFQELLQDQTARCPVFQELHQ